MLLILPIILPDFPKIFTPLFVIYSHAIIYHSYVILQIFIVSVMMMSAIYIVAENGIILS